MGVLLQGLNISMLSTLCVSFSLQDGYKIQKLVEHSALGPAVHPCVDGVQAAKTTRQPSPLTTMFGDLQNSVDHLYVGNGYIATLHR